MMTHPTVHRLLANQRVSSLEQLMDAYRAAGIEFRDSIDGGAAAGTITKQMLDRSTGTVHAFEPFPGNHPLFGRHDRVNLHKAALAETTGMGLLYVSSTVGTDSEWGRRGMAGYSSMGYLLDEYKAMKADNAPPETLYEVQRVRADDVIDPDRPVDVIKLDLQGGELNALKGMTRLCKQAKFLWVEYTLQPELAEWLDEQGFMLFDTEYFCLAEPSPELEAVFDVSKRDFPLSTGATACFGFPRSPLDEGYAEWFKACRANEAIRLIQTDLVCVHSEQAEPFMRAVDHLTSAS